MADVATPMDVVSGDAPHQQLVQQRKKTGSLSSGNSSAVEARPTWQADADADECRECKREFNLLRRRHHCRQCGFIFCDDDCNQRVPLPHLEYDKPVRVCKDCYARVVPSAAGSPSPVVSGGSSKGSRRSRSSRSHSRRSRRSRSYTLDSGVSRGSSSSRGQMARRARGTLLPPISRRAPVFGMIPELPPKSQRMARQDLYGDLKDFVMDEDERHVALVSVESGVGGVGKSILAAMICRDQEVRDHYTDGIFWLPLGPSVTPLQLLRLQGDLVSVLTGSKAALTSADEATTALQAALQGRSVLLVLDDVRAIEHWRVFIAAAMDAEESCVLATTRSPSMAEDAIGDDALVEVDALQPAEARDFFRDVLGREPVQPTSNLILTEALGHPLSISILGALLRDYTIEQWQEMGKQLRRQIKEYAGPHKKPHHRVLEIVLDMVFWHWSEQSASAPASAYATLSVLRDCDAVSQAVIATIIDVTPSVCKSILTTLTDLSLVFRVGPGLYKLHPLQLEYLRSITGDNIPQMHAAVVHRYAAKLESRGNYGSGPNDGHYFQQFCRHMNMAAFNDKLGHLLLNLNWMMRKLEVTDINCLLSDYLVLTPDVRQVQMFLQENRSVLASEPGQLPFLLQMAFANTNSAALATLVQHAADVWAARESLVKLMPRVSLGAAAQTESVLTGHTDTVRSVTQVDREHVLSGSFDGTARLWHVASGDIVKTLIGHNGPVNVVVRLTRDRVVTGSADRTLRVWNLRSGQCDLTLKGHTGAVTCAARLDASRIVSGSVDRSLIIWDCVRGKKVRQLTGHTKVVSAVTVLNRTHIATTSQDKTLRVWDLNSGQDRKLPIGNTAGPTTVMAISEQYLVTGSDHPDCAVRVWDVASGACKSELKGHSSYVCALFPVDEQRIASLSADKTIRVWNLLSKEVEHVLTGFAEMPYSAVALDAHRIVAGWADNSLKVINIAASRENPESHVDRVVAATAVGSRYSVTAAFNDRVLRVWDHGSGTCVRTLIGHGNYVKCLATIDDRHVVSGSDGLRVWDIFSGACLRVLDEHNSYDCVSRLDSRHFVGGTKRRVRVFDWKNSQVLRDLGNGPNDHDEDVYSVAGVAKDNVITGTRSGSLYLWVPSWSPVAGKCIADMVDDALPLMSCVDRKHLATGGFDGSVRVWNLDELRADVELLGHSAQLTALLSLNNRYLLSASEDRSVRVWDWRAQSCVSAYHFEHPVTSLAVCGKPEDDHRNVIVGFATGGVSFLELDVAMG